jgi:hypothetical protein
MRRSVFGGAIVREMRWRLRAFRPINPARVILRPSAFATDLVLIYQREGRLSIFIDMAGALDSIGILPDIVLLR